MAGKSEREGFGSSGRSEYKRGAREKIGEWDGERGRKKREENKRKVGRPTKVERLTRERSNSLPIVDLFKREEKWKERVKEKKDMEGMEAFKRSTKVERSPVRKKKRGSKDLLKEMRAGFKKIMRKTKE